MENCMINPPEEFETQAEYEDRKHAQTCKDGCPQCDPHWYEEEGPDNVWAGERAA